ncbi:hypothetical protein OG601_32945 [Streptomyces sp. NBC_01239]|uniref:hypothetical protein n=1 Tax=Streptomyces sp. NBC_01239 TaxID=2903792 RepID=UPI00224DEBFA|nr:hypothetical protein [Streptomyces sp. NBC_01239]MCX4815416.1 hypothetical protein [Streptomyces sp. NBC_01239]
MASQADLQYSDLRVGKEYRLSLPQAKNTSGEPVTVVKAQFVSLPNGLELVGYKVVNVEDTDGYGVGVLPAKGATDDVSGLPNRSGHGCQWVRPKARRHRTRHYPYAAPVRSLRT